MPTARPWPNARLERFTTARRGLFYAPNAAILRQRLRCSDLSAALGSFLILQP
jgi:hypothetical protein